MRVRLREGLPSVSGVQCRQPAESEADQAGESRCEDEEQARQALFGYIGISLRKPLGIGSRCDMGHDKDIKHASLRIVGIPEMPIVLFSPINTKRKAPCQVSRAEVLYSLCSLRFLLAMFIASIAHCSAHGGVILLHMTACRHAQS